MINITMRRYGEMARTKLYRETRSKLFEVKAAMQTAEGKTLIQLKSEEAELKAVLKGLRTMHRLSEQDFHKDVKPTQHRFAENIDSGEGLKTFNQQKCEDRFENFVGLHDLEVQRLTGRKNLSSMAI